MADFDNVFCVNAEIAQWWSSGFVNRRPRVRIPLSAETCVRKVKWESVTKEKGGNGKMENKILFLFLLFLLSSLTQVVRR